MLESILAWLREHDGPWSYVVIGLASLIEYVFPPFPGDAIAIVSICLAFAAGYRIALVYLTLVFGAVLGGQVMWWVGRRFGASEKRPWFLRGPRAKAALDEVTKRFEKNGALFLVVHRFIPALRAFVFVAAGMSGMSGWRVLFFGAISAAAWNGVLVGLGWLVSANWERLAAIVSGYSWVVIGILVVGAIVFFVRRRSAKKA